MNLLPTFICGRFRTKHDNPPGRITAPEGDELRSGHKLLSPNRDLYFAQSAATTAGCVAPFNPNARNPQ